MATIFPSRPGYVSAVADEDDVGFPFAVDGTRTWFGQFRSILCEMSIALTGNYQTLHTMNDVIYVYAYGNRIGRMQLSGLAFAGACGDSQSGGGGVERLADFYASNGVAARATTLSVQIGTRSSGRFRGLLAGFRANVVRPEARIAQFAMDLEIFPAQTTASR